MDALEKQPDGQPSQYVIRPDGEKRVVLPEELRRAKTADEIINTKTGRAGLPRRT
jgi:hypothetical protein